MNLNVEDLLIDEPLLEKGFEFIDGQAVEKPMGAKASRVIVNLLEVLPAFVRTHQRGHVFDCEGSYLIFPDQPRKVRKPDASLRCARTFSQ